MPLIFLRHFSGPHSFRAYNNTSVSLSERKSQRPVFRNSCRNSLKLNISPGDVEKLAQNIVRLLEDTDLRNEIALANYRYVRENFDITKIARRMEQFLKEVARRADGAWSVLAATSIWFEHDATEGLQLMLWILDEGNLEAKQRMVGQISGLAGLPHRFTADGIHEARFWVQRKMESPNKSPTP